MARITKDPDERCRELIARVQELFYSKGYERTTVGDIVHELGVAKGTFGIALSIIQSLSDSIYRLWLNPENYDDPIALAERKIAAVEAAIERVLGAPPGSLSLMDTREIAVWISD